MNPTSRPPVGELLRTWRQRRRLSQLDLACDAEISQRHLSFVESGRSQPSREMIERLATCLTIPLRERNELFLAGGFAPPYVERALDTPGMEAAREVIELVLKGHEPFPAIAVDRHWHLVLANRQVGPLLAGVDPALLEPPINVLRLSLHPQGMAPRIINYHEWRGLLLHQLRGQIQSSGDPGLERLLHELEQLPAPANAGPARAAPTGALSRLAVPLVLGSDLGPLSFLSTITVFGTPTDIVLSELAIESFFPADKETALALRRLADAPPGPH